MTMYLSKASVGPYDGAVSRRKKFYVRSLKSYLHLVLDRYGRTISSWDCRATALEQARILNSR